jgi:MFS family permease
MKSLYGIYATYSTGFNIIFKILPAFLASLFGAWEIALIFAAFYGARVLIIPAGLTSDRLGGLKTIRLSLSLMIVVIVGFILLTGATSLLGWIVFSFIAGLVVNLIEIAAATVAASQAKKTTSLFRLESMYQIGVIAGPIIGGFLMLYWGIEASLLSWGLLNVVGILLTSKMNISTPKKERLRGVFAAVNDRKSDFAVMLVLGSFILGFIQAMQELVFPLYLNSLGFDISVVGVVIGAGSVIALFALLYLGNPFEKKPVHLSLLVMFALMLVFPVAAPLTGNVAALAIAGGVFLVGRSASLNITRGFFSEFSDAYKATLIGVGETVYYFSRSVGSAVTGTVIQGFGYDATFIAMAIMTVVAMVLFCMIFFVKRAASLSTPPSRAGGRGR